LPSKRPLRRLRDVLENADLISQYTRDLDFELLKQNKLVRDAVERCLSRVSEAATKLGNFAERQFPAHNWKNIRDLGNILRHEYERVDAEIVWNIISHWLHPLVIEVRTFLAQYPEDQENL